MIFSSCGYQSSELSLFQVSFFLAMICISVFQGTLVGQSVPAVSYAIFISVFGLAVETAALLISVAKFIYGKDILSDKAFHYAVSCISFLSW